MNESENNSSSKEIDIQQLFLKVRLWIKFLYSKRVIIVIAMVIGAVIGFIYATQQKVRYTATLTFAMEDDKGSGGGLGGALGLASSLGIDLGTSAGGAFSGPNLIEFIKSRKLIEQTLLKSVKVSNEQITLAEMYLRFKGIRDKWNKNGVGKDIIFLPDNNNDRSHFTLQQDSILGIIYQSLSKKELQVEQKDKKISIITAEITTENELFSKFFIEQLIKEVSDYYIETKSKKARINLDILQHQTDSVRAELNSAISGVASSTDYTFNLNSAMNAQRTPATKKQVDVQANSAILTQLTINLELAKVNLRKETPLVQLIDTPVLPLEKQRLGKITSTAAAMAISFFLIVAFLSVSRVMRFSKMII